MQSNKNSPSRHVSASCSEMIEKKRNEEIAEKLQLRYISRYMDAIVEQTMNECAPDQQENLADYLTVESHFDDFVQAARSHILLDDLFDPSDWKADLEKEKLALEKR